MTYRKGPHQLRSRRNLVGKVETPLRVIDSSSISPQDKENQPSLSTKTSSREKQRNTRGRRTTPHIDAKSPKNKISLRSIENSTSQSLNQISLQDAYSLKECGVEFCPVCDFSTPIFKKFEEHIKLHIFNKLDSPNKNEEETFECAIKSKNSAMNDLSASISAKANEISKPVLRSTESEYLACPVCDFKTSIKRSFESHIKFHVEQYNVSANIEDVTETSEPDSRVNCTCVLISEKDGLMSEDEENDNSVEIVPQNDKQTSESEECKNARESLISEKDVRFSDSEEEDPIKIDNVFNFFTFQLPDKQSSLNHAKKPQKPRYELCFCGFITSIKKDFKEHVKAHVSSEKIATPTCDVKTKSDNLKELFSFAIPDKKNLPKKLTATCDKYDNQKSASTNIKKLRRHNKTNILYNVEDFYSCALCIFDTDNEKSLRTHINKNHKDGKSLKSEELFVCHTCDFICLSRKVLIAHQKLHETSKPYLCFYCKYSTDSSSNLEKHKKKHVPNFNCKACKYVTPSFIKFKSHIKTHVGPKPFLCTYCSFRCTQKQHMKSHIRTHTGEKPYKCSFCSFRCSTRYYRGVHEKIHTGEKPYKCDMCSYKCRALSYLNTHKRCHSEVRRYHCEKCDYKTRFRPCFTKHLQSKHQAA